MSKMTFELRDRQELFRIEAKLDVLFEMLAEMRRIQAHHLELIEDDGTQQYHDDKRDREDARSREIARFRSRFEHAGLPFPFSPAESV